MALNISQLRKTKLQVLKDLVLTTTSQTFKTVMHTLSLSLLTETLSSQFTSQETLTAWRSNLTPALTAQLQQLTEKLLHKHFITNKNSQSQRWFQRATTGLLGMLKAQLQSDLWQQQSRKLFKWAQEMSFWQLKRQSINTLWQSIQTAELMKAMFWKSKEIMPTHMKCFLLKETAIRLLAGHFRETQLTKLFKILHLEALIHKQTSIHSAQATTFWLQTGRQIAIKWQSIWTTATLATAQLQLQAQLRAQLFQTEQSRFMQIMKKLMQRSTQRKKTEQKWHSVHSQAKHSLATVTPLLASTQLLTNLETRLMKQLQWPQTACSIHSPEQQFTRSGLTTKTRSML